MFQLLAALAPFFQTAAGHILYLALHLESSSFPRPLSAKEEQAAFAALQAGGPAGAAARDTIIQHNLRLVAHIAKKYYNATGQDDLISMGTIGLIKAVNTFDPERRIKFSSYASQCIQNELLMFLRRTRREAPTISLQEPLEGTGGDGGMLTLADVLPDEGDMAADYEQTESAARVRALLGALDGGDPRARTILILRYGLGGQPPLTQQQVAERLGISRSYVSRLESKALSKLREVFDKGSQ